MSQDQPFYQLVEVADVQRRPSRFVEVGFYLSVLYSISGNLLPISIPLVGIGMLAALAALCVLSLRTQRLTVYLPIALPLVCGTTFVLIQILIHDESIMDSYVRCYVTWIVGLFVVHGLTLRDGFIHRFAFAALLIGMTVLPGLTVRSGSAEIERMGLETDTGLANPNSLASWFGFCALYFTIAGIETARGGRARMINWLIAAGCLGVIGLAVSRGPLIAYAFALAFALRRFLKRGFLLLLVLIAAFAVLIQMGAIDRIIDSYSARGMEDTGRLTVWPMILERIANDPLFGVGVSDIATWVPSKGKAITPHNGLLFVALGAGLIPVTLLALYFWRALRRATRVQRSQRSDRMYYVPLVVYSGLVMMTGNNNFMAPWAMVVLCSATTLGAPQRTVWSLVRREDVVDDGYRQPRVASTWTS